MSTPPPPSPPPAASSAPEWARALLAADADDDDDDDDMSYTYSSPGAPASSPSLQLTDEILDLGDGDVRRDLVLAQVLGDPAAAQELLARYRPRATRSGWCLLSGHQPSKDDGYVQLSWRGVNKLCTLPEVVAHAGGSVRMFAGAQASHLCHERRCMVEGHVVYESAQANNRRKGCRVWMACPHATCPLLIRLCSHMPACIKWHPGYGTQADFLRRARFHEEE